MAESVLDSLRSIANIHAQLMQQLDDLLCNEVSERQVECMAGRASGHGVSGSRRMEG